MELLPCFHLVYSCSPDCQIGYRRTWEAHGLHKGLRKDSIPPPEILERSFSIYLSIYLLQYLSTRRLLPRVRWQIHHGEALRSRMPQHMTPQRFDASSAKRGDIWAHIHEGFVSCSLFDLMPLTLRLQEKAQCTAHRFCCQKIQISLQGWTPCWSSCILILISIGITIIFIFMVPFR